MTSLPSGNPCLFVCVFSGYDQGNSFFLSGDIRIGSIAQQAVSSPEAQPFPGKELLEMTDLWSAKVWETGSREGPWPLTEEQISKGLNLARHPLFLCGVHRSGTTV